MYWIKEILRFKILDQFILFGLRWIFKSIRYFAKSKKKHNSKILVICLHRIGDTTFTFPAIRMLIDKYGENITILCYKHTKEVLSLLFDDDRLITVDKNLFFYKGWFASSNARKFINTTNAETIIDLTGSVTSASLIFLSSAKKIYGINVKYFKDIYDCYSPIKDAPHLMDRYNSVVSNFLKTELPNKYYNYKAEKTSISKILVHPYAGWKAKEWKLNNYIKLVEYLNQIYKTYLIFEKKDMDKDVIAEIIKQNIPLITTDSLNQLIIEIKSSSIFIGNDSGPLYIASVLGKPTFSIYGPTNPLFSLPFGENHGHITKTLKCSPQKDQYCFTFGGVYCPTHDCTSLLTFEDVKNSLVNFLSNVEKNIIK